MKAITVQLFKCTADSANHSPLDRGHMVPAADAKMSQMAMDETFILTNIAPQVGDGSSPLPILQGHTHSLIQDSTATVRFLPSSPSLLGSG